MHREVSLNPKEALEAILSTTLILLAYLDRDFNFIAVNQAYADAGRRHRDDFIGKNHFDLYPDAKNEAIFERAVESGRYRPFRPSRSNTRINPSEEQPGGAGSSFQERMNPA